jgi:hypothetical protein
MVHETTKVMPKAAFVEEQKCLKSAPELGETQVIPKIANVRKNNIVYYRQNRYQMPKGTYHPGRKARIEVDESAGMVRFYDYQSGEILEELGLARGTGRCVRNTRPMRDRKVCLQYPSYEGQAGPVRRTYRKSA